LVLVLFSVFPVGARERIRWMYPPEPVDELKTRSRLLNLIVAVVVWDCYVGVVVAVVVIVGDVINADEAGDAGVSTAVMDVTARNDHAWASQAS
jgi:hypothetical protein